MLSHRRLLVSALIAAVLALAVGAPFAVRSLTSGGAVAAASVGTVDYGSVPAYTLVDQQGATVKSSEFHGKVQVLSFLFPYCTTYCPIITRRLAIFERDLAAAHLANKVQLVSFNVDPTGAGPDQLAQFLRQYGANPADPDWVFLTGTAAQIHQVVYRGMGVYYRKVSLASENAEIAKEKKAGTYVPEPTEPNALAAAANVSYDIVHNDYIELATPSGKIVALYANGDQVTQSQLLGAVRDVLAGKAPPPQSSLR